MRESKMRDALVDVGGMTVLGGGLGLLLSDAPHPWHEVGVGALLGFSFIPVACLLAALLFRR